MKTKFSLLKKVAVITGAGSGIGKAIAITFAEQGADINILEEEISPLTDDELRAKTALFRSQLDKISNFDFIF